jgi:esterase/lipase
MSTTKFIKSNNKNLAYKIFEGEEQNILFLSGHKSTMNKIKNSDASLHKIHKICSEQNLKLTIFDYSGWGESEGEIEKPWNIKEWVINLCDIIKNMDNNITLIGISMGAYLSILMSILYPEKINKIITVVPGFGKSFTLTKQPLELCDKNNKKIIDLKLDEEDKAYINSKLNIKCPVYMLKGLKDNNTSQIAAQSIYNNLPDDTLKEIYNFNCGHIDVIKTEEAQDIIKKLLTS